GQVLPAGEPHRQRLRGPQPRVRVPAARGLRGGVMSDKETALRAEHEALRATTTGFAGWVMPLHYGSQLAEHRAVREAAGLFDLSHMGTVWVDGPQAGAFLDHAVVGSISTLEVGRAKYTLLCTSEGGIVDDLIVYRVGEDRFLTVP